MAAGNMVKKIDGKTCLSTSLIAEAFGVTSKAVNSWEKKGCPKIAHGYWYLPDILKWKDECNNKVEVNEDIEKMPINYQKVFYETQLKKAQTENADLKNAIARGDFLLKTEAVADLEKFFIIFKRSAMGLVSKIGVDIAPYLDPTEARRVEAKVRDTINDALEQFSENGVYKASKKR